MPVIRLVAHYRSSGYDLRDLSLDICIVIQPISYLCITTTSNGAAAAAAATATTTGWAELCNDVVLLGKAFCPHVQSLDPGVVWVPGRTVKACVFLIVLCSGKDHDGSRPVCSPGS